MRNVWRCFLLGGASVAFSSLSADAEQNLKLVEKILEYGDVRAIANLGEFFSETVLVHNPLHPEGKAFDTRLAKAFKKSRLDIQEIFAIEDKVVVYWTIQGIHQTNNRKIRVSGASIYRITNGKISEIWQSWDRLGLLEQLGEVRVCSHLVDLEPNYDTLKKFGLEKYIDRALSLSKREKECLIFFLEGKTAKETALALKLSFRTIESYFENIKTKLHCENKRDLLKMAQTLEKLALL